ncbi:hypothetical protein Leryth_014600, partial [Lithospermum erythrorhizon]
MDDLNVLKTLFTSRTCNIFLYDTTLGSSRELLAIVFVLQIKRHP